jgi:hypothetical protein
MMFNVYRVTRHIIFDGTVRNLIIVVEFFNKTAGNQ